MTWYGLVDPSSGNLVSVGTEAMFPDGNLNAFVGTYDTHVFGADRPEFSQSIWDKALRDLVPRPAPVWLSRIDDIEAWLTSDPDFLLAWNTLNATRKSQIRTGIRRIMKRLLGDRELRQESEPVEV